LSRKIINTGSLPVIYERVTSFPGLFTISVFFKTGSASERIDVNGVSHFIEHMAFRKTKSFSSEDISKLSEMYGGYMNAYTSKEVTSYYIKGFSDNLELFIKLLAEICFYPEFQKSDFEQEKKIILEEIASVEDNPEEFLGELAEEKFFNGSSLAYPVSGTIESVSALSLTDLKKFYDKNYCPENCVVAICGDIDIEEAAKYIEKYFPAATRSGDFDKPDKPVYSNFELNKEFKSGQMYSQMMYPAFAYNDVRRVPLGGLMSSRLFQQVREKRGLCYNIEAESVLYRSAGYFDVMYSCAPENSEKVQKLVHEEIEKITSEGITDDELITIKNQLKYAYYSNFENLESRVQMNFRHLFNYGELLTSDYILGLVDSLSCDSVNSIAKDIFSKEFSLCRLVP
jgi:predicted Zn-dependent peptidase